MDDSTTFEAMLNTDCTGVSDMPGFTTPDCPDLPSDVLTDHSTAIDEYAPVLFKE